MTEIRRPKPGERVKTCRFCQEPEHDHHAFAPVVAPSECNCSEDEWPRGTKEYPPICDAFEASEKNRWQCSTCGHLGQCHANKKSGTVFLMVAEIVS